MGEEYSQHIQSAIVYTEDGQQIGTLEPGEVKIEAVDLGGEDRTVRHIGVVGGSGTVTLKMSDAFSQAMKRLADQMSQARTKFLAALDEKLTTLSMVAGVGGTTLEKIESQVLAGTMPLEFIDHITNSVLSQNWPQLEILATFLDCEPLHTMAQEIRALEMLKGGDLRETLSAEYLESLAMRKPYNPKPNRADRRTKKRGRHGGKTEAPKPWERKTHYVKR